MTDIVVSRSSFEVLKLSDRKYKYINPSYKKINSKLSDWRCDVQLRVDGTVNFRAHRDILSDASEYFSAMFSHDMQEKSKNIIDLHETGPIGFQCLLDYVYRGHILIDESTVEDILETARFFQVNWIVSVVCDYLKERLNNYNFLKVVQLVDTYYLDDIYTSLFKHLTSNFHVLTADPDFNDAITFDFLCDFLSSDIFMETSEGYLLKLTFDWLNAYPEERDEYSFSLFKKIRYGLLHEDELESIPNYVLKYPEISEKVSMAQSYLSCVNTQCLKHDVIFQERGAKQTFIVMTACEFSNGTVILYKDPETTNTCIEEISTTNLEVELEYTAQVTIGNFLYACGGYEDDYQSSDRLFRYDPRYREWFELRPMLSPRLSFGICTSDYNIYVIGGVQHVINNHREDDIILSSVECYDTYTNSWSILCDIPLCCYGLAAVFHDDTIFITGGITSDPVDPVPTNYMLAHVIGSEQWSPLPVMINSRYNHGMAAINNRLYVLGGKTSHVIGALIDCFEVEHFDLLTYQWTQVFSLPQDLGPVSSEIAIFKRCIGYLVGSLLQRCLFVYDTESNKIVEQFTCGPGFNKITTLPVAFPRA